MHPSEMWIDQLTFGACLPAKNVNSDGLLIVPKPSFTMHWFNPLQSGIQKLPPQKFHLYQLENVSFWQYLFKESVVLEANRLEP